MVRKIYNPIDLNRFNSSSHDPNVKPELEIIFAGRLTGGKNLFLWIEVAEFLLKNGIKAAFNIYGNGELYSEIEKRLRNSKYRENIKLKGHVSRIEEVYKNADLLLFLSEYESFGNVVVESILCGVPVIAVNIPAMEEIFNEFPVFLIDKDKNIAEQVLHKVRQYDMLRSAANKAANNFTTKFGTKQHIDQLSTLYLNLESIE